MKWNLIIVGLLLLVLGIQDLRKKQVSFSILLITWILGLGYTFFMDFSWMDFLRNESLGVVLLLVGKLSQGGIGIGDGLLLLVTGLFLGWQKNCCMFLGGIILCGLVGMILLIGKKVRGKTALPFIPFLLVSYGVMCVVVSR